MKHVCILYLVFFSCTTAFSQETPIAIGKVNYQFIHVRDTNDRENPHKEEMILLINKQVSKYTSYVRMNEDRQMKENLNQQIRNNGGVVDGIRVSAIQRTPTIPQEYFQFHQEQKLYIVERLINNYVTTESLPVLSWKILKDTADFSGIRCQKATTRFGGREWTAWFAPDMPFVSGPWKLNGLPGLIMEAYDATRDVQFLFSGFEAVDAEKIRTQAKNQKKKSDYLNIELMEHEIKIPNNVLHATKAELDQLKKIRREDPMGFAKAQLAGNPLGKLLEGKVSVPAMPPSTLNNPIELP